MKIKHLLFVGGFSFLMMSSPAYASLKEAVEAINEQDYSFALEELNRLIEQEKDMDAVYHLGRMYEEGMGVEKNEAEALRLYRQAAEGENEKAALKLGNAYYTGNGFEKDYQEAFNWYSVAAKKGSFPAQYNIGLMYEEGLGVKKDTVKAFQFYQKSADQGYAPAQISLGKFFLNGIGTPQDFSKAVFWYKLGADQGDFDAQMTLAKLYANTSVRGLPFSIVGAHVYFNLIAAYGSSPLKEEGALLRDNLTKEMSNEDVYLAQKRANRWRKKTREESLPSRVVEGITGDEDDDFTSDVQEDKSDKKGTDASKIEVSAKTNMQDLLVAAGISRRDLNKAVRADDFAEIEKALKEKEDDDVALLALGDLYVLGQGIPENPKEAMAIYKKLIEKNNNPIAFYRLAPMVCEGNGVDPDLAECYKLMTLAKKYSDEASLSTISDALQVLDENLDKEIRDLGKKMADEWGTEKKQKKKKRFGLFGGDEDDEKKEEAKKEKKEEAKKAEPEPKEDDLFSEL